MDLDVERLLQDLEGSSEESKNAQAALLSQGRDVVPALARGLPSLSRFGQLAVIEVFEELGDPRCCPALIELLAGEHDAVREWAALTLMDFEYVDAVEPLRRAYDACRDRGTPPEDSEADAIRCALTRLGARTPVEPPLTVSLVSTGTAGDELGASWPCDRLAEVVGDLADHGQVVLRLQFWHLREGGVSWVREVGQYRELDWTKPWDDLVEDARTWAMSESAETAAREDMVATIWWIDLSDAYS